MANIFDEVANFSRIKSDGVTKELTIDRAVHAASLELDEDGTEATDVKRCKKIRYFSNRLLHSLIFLSLQIQ